MNKGANGVIYPCWNKEGVWAGADRSCERLKTVVHCRNCEKYIQSGRQFLVEQSHLDEEDRERWGDLYALKPQEVVDEKHKLTLIRVADELLALESEYIVTVIEARESCWIPHKSGSCIMGVINVDGEAIVLVSLQKFLGVQESKKEQTGITYPRIVLVGDRGSPIALYVDDLKGGLVYRNDNVKALGDDGQRKYSNYCAGVLTDPQGLVGCLDGDKLLTGLERALS